MKEDLERSHELSRFKPCRHRKVLGKARKTIRGSFCNFFIFHLFFLANLILTTLIKKCSFVNLIRMINIWILVIVLY